MKKNYYNSIKFILSNFIKPLSLIIFSSIIFTLFDWHNFIFLNKIIPKDNYSINCSINYILINLIIDYITKKMGNNQVKISLNLYKSNKKGYSEKETIEINNAETKVIYFEYIIDGNIEKIQKNDEDYIIIKTPDLITTVFESERYFPGQDIKIKLSELKSNKYALYPMNIMLNNVNPEVKYDSDINVELNVSFKNCLKFISINEGSLSIEVPGG